MGGGEKKTSPRKRGSDSDETTQMLDSKLPLSYGSGSQRRYAPTTGNFGPKQVVTFTEIGTVGSGDA